MALKPATPAPITRTLLGGICNVFVSQAAKELRSHELKNLAGVHVMLAKGIL